MKDTIVKWFASLAVLASGALSGWLLEERIATPEQVPAIEQQVQDAVTGVGALVGSLASLGVVWVMSKVFGPKRSDSKGSTGGGFSPAIALVTAGALCIGLLPSCSTLDEVSGSAVFVRPDGSKAGLTLEPGENPTGFLTYPIRDSETGEIKGWIEIDSTGTLKPQAAAVTPEK